MPTGSPTCARPSRTTSPTPARWRVRVRHQGGLALRRHRRVGREAGAAQVRGGVARGRDRGAHAEEPQGQLPVRPVVRQGARHRGRHAVAPGRAVLAGQGRPDPVDLARARRRDGRVQRRRVREGVAPLGSRVPADPFRRRHRGLQDAARRDTAGHQCAARRTRDRQLGHAGRRLPAAPLHDGARRARQRQLDATPPRLCDALDRRRRGLRAARRPGRDHDRAADDPAGRADRLRGVSPLVAEASGRATDSKNHNIERMPMLRFKSPPLRSACSLSPLRRMPTSTSV